MEGENLPRDILATVTKYLDGLTTGTLLHLVSHSVSSMESFFGRTLRAEFVLEFNYIRPWARSVKGGPLKYYPLERVKGCPTFNLAAITSFTCVATEWRGMNYAYNAAQAHKQCRRLLKHMPNLTYLDCTSFLLADMCKHVHCSDKINLPSLVTLKVTVGWRTSISGDYFYPFECDTLIAFSAPNLETVDFTDCIEEYFPLDVFNNLKCIRGLSMQNLLPSRQNIPCATSNSERFMQSSAYLIANKPFYRVLETLEVHFRFAPTVYHYGIGGGIFSASCASELCESLVAAEHLKTLVIKSTYCSSLELIFSTLLELSQVRELVLDLQWPAEYGGLSGLSLIREYLVNSMKSYHKVNELIDQGMRVAMYTPDGRQIMFAPVAYLIREHAAQDTKEGTPVDFSVRFRELQFDFVLIHYAQHREEYLRLEHLREIAKLWLD